ncbi:MAG: hypothetical protein L3K18_07510 [Thermoplasmata archaeon]|nr:hypothetical protein [Thermoplasmata archaeon]
MNFTAVAIALVIVVLVVLVLLLRSRKTVRPYETAILVRFGSFRGTLGPGLNMVSPVAQVIRVDLRTRSASVGPFAAPVANGTSILVSGRAEYRVVNAAKSVFQTQDLTTSLRVAMKDATAGAVAAATPENPTSKGWAVAEETRRKLAEFAVPVGVEFGRRAVSLPGTSGPTEFLTGDPSR